MKSYRPERPAQAGNGRVISEAGTGKLTTDPSLDNSTLSATTPDALKRQEAKERIVSLSEGEKRIGSVVREFVMPSDEIARERLWRRLTEFCLVWRHEVARPGSERRPCLIVGQERRAKIDAFADDHNSVLALVSELSRNCLMSNIGRRFLNVDSRDGDGAPDNEKPGRQRMDLPGTVPSVPVLRGNTTTSVLPHAPKVSTSARAEPLGELHAVPAKRGRPRIEEAADTLTAQKPWAGLMSRSTWYRRRKEEK